MQYFKLCLRTQSRSCGMLKPAATRHLNKLIIVVLSALLTACGFHLRGVLDMPPWLNQVNVITENANPDLAPLINEQLYAYHIHVCDDPAIANYWLIVEQDNLQQRIVSISSSTTPRQYQLIYTVRFKLQRAKGKEIIPLSTVTEIRQHTINSNRILGSNDEGATLAHEMRRDAAIQIMHRLSAAVP